MSDAKKSPLLGFEVLLNGKHFCTSGAEGAQVLSAMVTWTARPDAGASAPAPPRLEVGGLVDDAHLRWAEHRPLQVGDEIRLRVVETSEPDAPTRIQRDDKALVEMAQRRYYEHLKAKYEGSPAEGAAEQEHAPDEGREEDLP